MAKAATLVLAVAGAALPGLVAPLEAGAPNGSRTRATSRSASTSARAS